ncbi:MAG: dihydrodipicolinate synthase family protein [Actinomycetota bacterium]|nr:dihydrodipicolinate synthase family protein [Actinomycetota bacterium]
MKKFEGIFAVMLSAYDHYGDIDREAMCHMTDYLAKSGVHGLVVLGSNGECPYLTHDHQKQLIDAVVETCAGKVPVIVGINERGVDPALEMALYADSAGAEGLLLALPLFYKLDDTSIYGFYEKVCGAVSLPVLYYNYPANTGLDLSPEGIAAIAEIDNLVGAKETIFDVDDVRELVEATDEAFCVFTGMTFNLQATMSVGACGAICPLPNIIPEKTVELFEACKSGDEGKAIALQNEVYSFSPLLANTPTPHAMQKEALRLLGHPIRTTVKSPLPQLTPEQAGTVKETLEKTGII